MTVSLTSRQRPLKAISSRTSSESNRCLVASDPWRQIFNYCKLISIPEIAYLSMKTWPNIHLYSELVPYCNTGTAAIVAGSPSSAAFTAEMPRLTAVPAHKAIDNAESYMLRFLKA
jgi:hypothetical protein